MKEPMFIAAGLLVLGLASAEADHSPEHSVSWGSSFVTIHLADNDCARLVVENNDNDHASGPENYPLTVDGITALFTVKVIAESDSRREVAPDHITVIPPTGYTAEPEDFMIEERTTRSVMVCPMNIG